jgi:hypothetical protein
MKIVGDGGGPTGGVGTRISAPLIGPAPLGSNRPIVGPCSSIEYDGVAMACDVQKISGAQRAPDMHNRFMRLPPSRGEERTNTPRAANCRQSNRLIAALSLIANVDET